MIAALEHDVTTLLNCMRMTDGVTADIRHPRTGWLCGSKHSSEVPHKVNPFNIASQ
jgi:hypothetical protein